MHYRISPFRYEDILTMLTPSAWRRLCRLAGLSPNTSYRKAVQHLLFQLTDGDLYCRLPEEAQEELDHIIKYGGCLEGPVVEYFSRWYLCDQFQYLKEYGFLMQAEDGAIFMPVEFLFLPQASSVPSRTLAAFLKFFEPKDLDQYCSQWNIPSGRHRAWRAAELLSQLSARRRELLSDLTETEEALLQEIIKEDFTFPLSRIEKLAGDTGLRRTRDVGEWVLSGAERGELLPRLAYRGLAVPGENLFGDELLEFYVPHEAWEEFAAWFRSTLTSEGFPRFDRNDPDIHIRSSVNLIDIAKRVLIELLSLRIRITKNLRLHGRDQQKLQKRLDGVLPGHLNLILAVFNALGFFTIESEEQRESRFLSLTSRADHFLRLQGRDRERYLWYLFNEGYLPSSAELPSAPSPPEELPWKAADILSFLPREKLLPAEILKVAFCRSPYLRPELPENLNRMLLLLASVGWITIGQSEEDLLLGRSDRGESILQGGIKEVPLPRSPERPFLVQPNGRVVADPETSLSDLTTLARLADPASVDPVYCFQLSLDKITQAVIEGVPAEGPLGFLAERSRVAIPKTVARLFEDTQEKIVKSAFVPAGGVLVFPSAEKAQWAARITPVKRVTVATVGRCVLLKPDCSPSALRERLKSEGISVEYGSRAVIPGETSELDASQSAKDIRSALRQAAREGLPVEISYRTGRHNNGEAAVQLTVEKVTPRCLSGIDAEGRRRRISLQKIISVKRQPPGVRDERTNGES